MILQDKAKEDFRKWVKENDYPVSLWALEDGLIDKTVEYALIIEWLDSVGIHIGSQPHHEESAIGMFLSYIVTKEKSIRLGDYFNSRQEATKAAIEKANEIYNSQHFAP